MQSKEYTIKLTGDEKYPYVYVITRYTSEKQKDRVIHGIYTTEEVMQRHMKSNKGILGLNGERYPLKDK